VVLGLLTSHYHQGRHHRLRHRDRHRSLQSLKEFRPASARSRCATIITGSKPAAPRRRSSSSAFRMRVPASTPSLGRRPADGRTQPARDKAGQVDARLQVFETPSGNYTDLVMRQDAIRYATRTSSRRSSTCSTASKFARRFFQGFAVIGNDQPSNPSNRFYCPDIPQTAYDPGQGQVPPAEGRPHRRDPADLCVPAADQLDRDGRAAAADRRASRPHPRHQEGAGRTATGRTTG